MKRSFGAKILGCTVGASMVLGGLGTMVPQAALASGDPATGDAPETFLGELEDTFDLELDESEVLKITTLGEALNLLEELQ